MRALRIAMLAPPWIPVPAPGYGGIEEVVRLLAEGLVERGHEVTLFAAPGSDSPADVRPVLESAHPHAIDHAQFEADHVARAFAAIDEDGGFDVVHDHTGHVALAMAGSVGPPLVHTLHGPFDEAACAFYRVHGAKGQLVALSEYQRAQAPDEAGDPVVVSNPLRVEEWPFGDDREDFLLWIGRMSPDKGPHRAIEAARRAGVPLVLAGPIQPGQEGFFAAEVEPRLEEDGIAYVGEADGARKRDLYRRARGLLMPIRWPEPFGLVMVEAMACGTPVIAFPEGSAPELVVDGETARCRAATGERFGVGAVVDRYVDVYRRAAVTVR
jgi:glycosyltransferase involved in cell wall biosynthesis